MAKKENTAHVHEPLFHIAKRDALPLGKSILIRTAAILLALVVCAIVCFILIKINPIELYTTMVEGVFGTSRRIWKFLKDSAVLLCFALAVTPAFKMKFWNIGAEGQVLVSCLASVACMYYLKDSVPTAVLILLMLISSVVAGAAWAFLPAICKAQWNTNETLFTLMMNYVATNLVAFFLIKWTPDGSSSLGSLPYGHLPQILNEYLLLIIVVAVLTVGMYVYLKYSKQGYEISVVGESQKTASYIGISVKKVIIRTMLVSGAICGLAGFLIVGALDHSVTTESAGGQGFTAIMVSWLGKFNPFIMIITSFLMIFLQQGADRISTEFNISNAFPSIVTGVILFFIIGCEFFINYKIIFRQKEDK